VADQTRDRIVDAAYRALVKRGYHETSMKDIAEEAGVALGLAHYYFETKEDLLVAAIERGCAPLLEELRRVGLPVEGGMPPGVDAYEAARRGFELSKEELRRYRELHILVNDMFGVGLHNPKIGAAVKRFITERRALVAAIAVAMIPQMPRPPAAGPDAIAGAIWGAFHGIAVQKLIDPSFDADAALDALAEIVFTFAAAGAVQDGSRR
jgi:AcrR family transcriptional regulator